jgi:hypothetical protein
MKQIACLEACKKLHEIGALTDNLVPDIVVEEGTVQECGNFIVLEPFIPSCFDCLPLYNVFFNIGRSLAFSPPGLLFLNLLIATFACLTV